ncbi:nuclear transport factor 2 family protein [Sphingomonas crusticola]|uniref:nuclear transport factor 2 family protein n=1 Tax=Sphingomonas crusticola TaxID=1697973 RepID=UPI000E2256D7|nr:nuclear transport factor 2 family protein [Sphingomonas crusticola]
MRNMVLFAASILTLGAPAVGQTPAENAEIRAAAQAFDDAQLHGDRAVLERMLAPDFLLVRGSGRIGGKADFIAGFTDPKSHLEPFEITDRLFIRPSADTAIVGGEARVRGTDNGKPFAEHFRYSDTFARRDERWIVVYTQVTPLPAP